MFADITPVAEFRDATPMPLRGRYEIAATVHGVTVTTLCDDLALARAMLSASLEQPFADDDQAHGGIYDRRAFHTVHSWRGGYRAPRVNPIIAMFERAIASGAKVMLATPAAMVEFEGGRISPIAIPVPTAAPNDAAWWSDLNARIARHAAAQAKHEAEITRLLDEMATRQVDDAAFIERWNSMSYPEAVAFQRERKLAQ